MSESKLFRQKSLDKISSPEKLNDYIMVMNPGVWMILVSVILVLIGMIVWGTFGRLETRVDVPIIVDDKEASLYVEAEEMSRIRRDQIVEIGDDYRGYVVDYGSEGEKAEDVLGDLILSEAKYDKEDIVYDVSAHINAPNGIYMGEIIVDRVSPMSFIFGDNNQ